MSGDVAAFVLLSIFVLLLILIITKYWNQNRRLKRRIDYYVGVLDLVKRHVDLAIVLDPTNPTQETNQELKYETRNIENTPTGSLEQNPQFPKQMGELPENPSDLPLPISQPTTSLQSATDLSSPPPSQGLLTLRRTADYIELTLRDPSPLTDSAPYTPLIWLKKQQQKLMTRSDNNNSRNQQTDYRCNVLQIQDRAETSSTRDDSTERSTTTQRSEEELTGVRRNSHTQGRLQANSCQLQSVLIRDELMTRADFKGRTNNADKERYIDQDACTGRAQHLQMKELRAGTEAEQQGNEQLQCSGRLPMDSTNDEMKRSYSLKIQQNALHNQRCRQPKSAEFHRVVDRCKSANRDQRTDLKSDEKSDDPTSSRDSESKYVNINYHRRSKRKKEKSNGKYVNLPF